MRVEARFYTLTHMRRLARQRRHRLGAHLLRFTAGEIAHVNVAVGPFLFESNWLEGFTIAASDRYPCRPFAILPLNLPRLGLDPHEWTATRFTITRAVLDCLGCPRILPVRSCVTRTCDLLGVRRQCRRPADLLAALKDGDYDHEFLV